jgi:hypothetical protein
MFNKEENQISRRKALSTRKRILTITLLGFSGFLLIFTFGFKEIA